MSHQNGGNQQNGRHPVHSELCELLEALCEDRMTRAQSARLEALVLDDREALRFYLDYIDLHGSLYWDTAQGAEDETPSWSDPSEAAPAAPAAGSRVSGDGGPAAARLSGTFVGRHRWIVAFAVSACLLLAFGWSFLGRVPPNADAPGLTDDFPASPARDGDGGGLAESSGQGAAKVGARRDHRRQREHRRPDEPPRRRLPERLPLVNRDRTATEAEAAGPARPDTTPPDTTPEDSVASSDSIISPEQRTHPDSDPVADVDSGSPPVVEFIDEQIRASWEAADVRPSPVADDGEWIRRVYLDIVGHIPPADVVDDFLNDRNPQKRSLLVERLLDDPVYVRNWTTVWANLLVGRAESREVNRPALQKFLRESFARNRPWSEIVADLVSAEGPAEENGAAGFLLAHLNNEAVPATAITARLFLGTQVHCTQCHDHPLNDWKQNQFWELNSFFQQTEIARHRSFDPGSGQTVTQIELVSRDVGGPVYYETPRGLMQVAFPRFAGQQVDADPGTNRRRELAKLMTEGEQPLVARALVNRMWEHFFGSGFTRPVDDMGPHNPPTHPALLDRLAEEFAGSGYDLKQLIRWICRSEAYQLTSRFNESNTIDDPQAGQLPLFSRVYVKSMSAEQLYDSLLVATRAHHAGRSDWDAVERQRQEWLQQFVVALETEENDEATMFEGTIPQALMRMNSPLMERAVSGERGTYLHEVLREGGDPVEKVRRLCLSALSRYPTAQEVTALKKLLRERSSRRDLHGGDHQVAMLEGLQDVFWAYLNSSEFILIP